MSARILEGIERSGRRGPNASARSARSSSLNASVAARAADRAVSGRRAPGIATTPGARPRSQASATSSGCTSSRCAIATSSASARQPGRAARAAERRVRDHHDPGLATPLDDASADRPVVEQAQRDLDRGDRCELERLVELSAVDVRHPDAADELARRRAAPGLGPTSATASADRARGSGRGRSGGRRATRGSPRSRRGRPLPARRAPMRCRPAACRPSSRSALLPRRRCGGARGRAAARCGRAPGRRGRTTGRCRRR